MINNICTICHKEFSAARSAKICSSDCRKFYDNTAVKLMGSFAAGIGGLKTEDDFKKFFHSELFDSRGKLRHQLLSTPLFAIWSGVDLLRYARAHNDQKTLTDQVLVWLYDIQPVTCGCGAATAFDSKKLEFRKYCSEACYAKAIKVGGVGRKVILESVKQKYGVENVFQSDAIKEKAKQTLLTKTGESNIMKTPTGKGAQLQSRRLGKGWSKTKAE